jgi:hypothetical protein
VFFPLFRWLVVLVNCSFRGVGPIAVLAFEAPVDVHFDIFFQSRHFRHALEQIGTRPNGAAAWHRMPVIDPITITPGYSERERKKWGRVLNSDSGDH